MVVPVWAQGIDVAVLTLWKQNVAADGTMSDDGAFGAMSIQGTVTGWRPRSENQTRDLGPMTRRQMNNVVTRTGTSMNFTGLIKSFGSNQARVFAFGADYGRAIVTAGAMSENYFGLVQSYEEDWSLEQATYTLVMVHVDDLSQVGTSVSQPTFSGTI